MPLNTGLQARIIKRKPTKIKGELNCAGKNLSAIRQRTE